MIIVNAYMYITRTAKVFWPNVMIVPKFEFFSIQLTKAATLTPQGACVCIVYSLKIRSLLLLKMYILLLFLKTI